MGWIEALAGKVVAADTSPFICFIEQNPSYHASLRPFFLAASCGEFAIITSVLTLTEVLAQPIRKRDLQLADRYGRILLRSAHVQALPASAEIASLAAEFRAAFNLRTPDAVQLATGVFRNATHFLTNDSRIPELPGMKLLLVDRLR